MAQSYAADHEIVARYLARDEHALALTERKYGDYCFAIAHNILKNREDSEECVNDTWLQTWNTIPPQKPASLKHYLAKITRNLSITRWREAHREKRGGGETALALEEMEEFLSGSIGIDDEAARVAFADCLNRFLHRLPARECNVFLRRYFYVDSTAQIAKAYGMRESNVLVILSRTRAKLREYLEQEGYTV